MADQLVLGVILACCLLLAVVVVGGLLADGLYQVVSGRPSFIPVERVIRKRVPASPADCLVQGAAKVVQVIGLVIMMLVPGSLILMPLLLANPGAGWSRWASLAYLVVAYSLALLCFGVAVVLHLRVRYVSTETGASVSAL